MVWLSTQSAYTAKKRESVNYFVYIKFPFGLLDYNRLKELQAYHEHKKIKQREKEEDKMWLTKSTHIGKSMRVDTNMING